MRFTEYKIPSFRPPSGKMRLGPLPGNLATGPSKLIEQTGFGSNPGELRMFAYLPKNLPANAPLVVILHGCTQTAAGYDHGAGWTDLADEAGFAVLAPEQQHSNNVSNCFNWFQPGDTTRGEGEAASIHQMVTRLVADHNLDPRRVFITGLSAGGAMSAAMLTLYPDDFAGGAIIAGLPYGSANNVPEALNHMRQAPQRSGDTWANEMRNASASPHRGAWPKISIWHGDADPTVNVSNGEALVAQWLALHGLTHAASRSEFMDGYVKRSWKTDAGETPVEAYTIEGMGHGTPVGGVENYGHAGKHFFDVGLSSSVRIAEFWGIVNGPVRTRPRQPNQEQSFVSGLNLGAMKTGGVKTAIVKALKAAGLM